MNMLRIIKTIIPITNSFPLYLSIASLSLILLATANNLKNNHVIISKNSNPTIHFVIRHPKLVAAIESFNPLVKEL